MNEYYYSYFVKDCIDFSSVVVDFSKYAKLQKSEPTVIEPTL